MAEIEPVESLDSFYAVEDPWGYEGHLDDHRRLSELRSLLPARRFQRALDIGCGNGFVTFHLPANSVVGIDLSPSAIEWCRKRLLRLQDADRFTFEARSIFDIGGFSASEFDLVVVTGVLYHQYIGKSISLVSRLVDHVLAERGILVSCHIDEWLHTRLPYTLIDQSLYPYRGYTHRLEVMVK